MSEVDKPGKRERIAWHPAFYEAIQMELERYQDVLTFESEYQLTEEPLKMDVLIIKKERDVVIDKNIGALFRKDNIVEYKSPDDYVSVEDFYKVYGYACFYASLNKADIRDITVTFVETRYPKELLKHLREVRKYEVTEKWAGIYQVTGDILPVQIIESKKLAEEENLWLRNLGNELDARSLDVVLTEGARQGKAARIRAYIDALLRANTHILQEVIEMGYETLDEVLVKTGLTQKWVAEGESRGETQRNFAVAKNALREGLPIETVQRITGLDANTIRGLR